VTRDCGPIPRGAWSELRAYRKACRDFEALEARHPREWFGCALKKRDELKVALNERDAAYQAVLAWAAGLRWRVDEHVEAEAAAECQQP
jgi:hypothetical protein